MVKLCGAPAHPFAEGVTIIFPDTGALVRLMAANAGILPVPLGAKPIDGLSLVQLKPVPLTAPVKFIVLVNAPLHKTWFPGETTFGVGFTVMVKLNAAPRHPFATGNTLMV